MSYKTARWCMAGWDAVEKAESDGKLLGVMQLADRYERPVLLFPSEWKLRKEL